MAHNNNSEIADKNNTEEKHWTTLFHVASSASQSENIIFEDEENNEYGYNSINYASYNILEINHCVEFCVNESRLVNITEYLRLFPIILLIKYSIYHDRKCSVNCVEKFIVVNVEHNNSREVRINSEGDNGRNMVPIFEETVANKSCIFPIPLSSIIEDNKCKILELTDSNISNSGGFCTLFTFHSDTNISFQDHVNIVSSITYGHSQTKVLVFLISENFSLNMFNNILLLNWCAPVTNCLILKNIIWHITNIIWSIYKIDFFILVSNSSLLLFWITENLSFRLDKTTRTSNTNSSLFFISCQNEELDACSSHHDNSLSNFILKSIFHSGTSDKFHIFLNHFISGSQIFLSVLNRRFGFVVVCIPLLEFIIRNGFSGQHQSSQTLDTELFQELFSSS